MKLSKVIFACATFPTIFLCASESSLAKDAYVTVDAIACTQIEPCENGDELVFSKSYFSSAQSNEAVTGTANDWLAFTSASAEGDAGKRTFKVSASAQTLVPNTSFGANIGPAPSALGRVTIDDIITVSTNLIPFTNLALYFFDAPKSGTLTAEGWYWGGDASVRYRTTIGNTTKTYEKSYKSSFGQGYSESDPFVPFFVVKAGVPTPLKVVAEASATATPRTGSLFGYIVEWSSSATADYSHTFQWGGIEKIVNLEDGSLVTDWTLTSASGIAWELSSPVPELNTTSYIVLGLFVVLFSRLRRFDSKAKPNTF